MLEQVLHIDHDQVDKRATRKKVESLLETVRLYQTLGGVRRDSGRPYVQKWRRKQLNIA